MAPGWCTRKGLRLYQIIRNVTSDLGIPLVVIQPLVLELKKTRLMDLPDLFEGRRKKGKCDLVCVCEVPLDDWANGGYVDFFFTCREYGFSSLESWSWKWCRIY